MTLKLAVFDFDNTIVNENVYSTICNNLLINKCLSDKVKTDNWIERMNVLFEMNCLTEEKIKKYLKDVKIDETMKMLLKHLFNNGYEMIIISDNNSFFIDYILKDNNVRSYFKKIYTNEGRFDKNGILKLTGLNEVLKETFECYLEPNKCQPNICKRLVLSHHIKKINLKGNLIYVGDGNNDFCPAYELNESDVLCIRKGYALEKLVASEGYSSKTKAKIIYWSNGYDLTKILELKQ